MAILWGFYIFFDAGLRQLSCARQQQGETRRGSPEFGEKSKKTMALAGGESPSVRRMGILDSLRPKDGGGRRTLDLSFVGVKNAKEIIPKRIQFGENPFTR